MSYKPSTRAEQDAMEMWHDAAAKGGLYWAMMVGQWTQAHGETALSRACPCATEVSLSEATGDVWAYRAALRHVDHPAERLAAVRDVFEHTWSRRLLRLGRWVRRGGRSR